MYKNTILIVYPSGGYGTFLDWCINWFSGHITEDTLPFTSNGSSHRWKGQATEDVTAKTGETIEWFLNHNDTFLTLRTHLPHCDIMTKEKHVASIKSYRSKFRKIVIINNDINYHLLFLHNMLSKTRAVTYDTLIPEIIDQYSQTFNAKEPIPNWQLREMISFWHENWHCYLRDIYQPINDTNIINVKLNDLLNNFETCIENLLIQLELPILRRSELIKIKNQWLSLQKFLHTDQQCENIISSVINNQNLNFENLNLHLIDEAYIQYKLRVYHGLDLLCTDLDPFPTNSIDLRKALVPYVDKQLNILL